MILNLFTSSFIVEGGPVQTVLLILSIVSLAAIIDQFILNSFIRFSLRGAKQERIHSFMGNRYHIFIQAWQITERNEASKLIRQKAIDGLFRNVDFLGLMSAISPVLGVLGTVHGIILTFLEIRGKTDVQFADISLGISHALYTTAYGLIICLVCLIMIWTYEKQCQGLLLMAGIEETAA